MSWQTADLRLTGPVLELQVAVAESLERQLVRTGAPVPLPRQILGLIDTGSSVSTISPILAAALDTRPHDKVWVTTMGGRVQIPRCSVRLRFPPNGFEVKTHVLMKPLGGTRLQCLIGRDVLAHADFRYEGRFGWFELRF